jgi:hypothetical protein
MRRERGSSKSAGKMQAVPADVLALEFLSGTAGILPAHLHPRDFSAL